MKALFLKLKKQKKVVIIVFTLLVVLLVYSAWTKIPQPPNSVKNVTELDAYLEKLVNWGTPQGLSIAIVKNDSVVYSKGFGLADGPRNIQATPESVYHWWSITKIPTSIAILQLQEQGLLQLDDSVSMYLSFFKVKYPSRNSSAITIRQLLNHSSGIPDASVFDLMKWIHHDGEPHLNQTEFIEKVFYNLNVSKTFRNVFCL